MNVSRINIYLKRIVLLIILIVLSWKFIIHRFLFFPQILSELEDGIDIIFEGVFSPIFVGVLSGIINKHKLSDKVGQTLHLKKRLIINTITWWTILSILFALLSLLALIFNAIGISLQNTSRTEFARGMFNWATILDPPIVEYRYRLGYSYIHSLNWDDVKSEFNIIIKLDQEFAFRRADEFNKKGIQRIYDSQTDEAIMLFKLATLLAPNYAEFHYNLCSAYNQMGDPELAKAQCKIVIEQDSNYAAAYSILGHLYWKEGKCRESVELLTIGLDRINSSLESVYYVDLVRYKLLKNIGGAYLCVDPPQYDLAISSLFQAIDIEHNYIPYSDWVKLFRPAETHCLLAIAFGRNRSLCEHIEKELTYCKNYALNDSLSQLEKNKDIMIYEATKRNIIFCRSNEMH